MKEILLQKVLPRAEPEKYKALIHSQDREGILAALTDSDVEDRVIARVQAKAERYGPSCGAQILLQDV